MLAGGLVSGSVAGTYYSLFQKEISKISTVTPSLFGQNHRITRHHISVTRYKNVIKTATTGRQPVYVVTSNKETKIIYILLEIVLQPPTRERAAGPEVIFFYMLNSAEHEILNAHKY